MDEYKLTEKAEDELIEALKTSMQNNETRYRLLNIDKDQKEIDADEWGTQDTLDELVDLVDTEFQQAAVAIIPDYMDAVGEANAMHETFREKTEMYGMLHMQMLTLTYSESQEALAPIYLSADKVRDLAPGMLPAMTDSEAEMPALDASALPATVEPATPLAVPDEDLARAAPPTSFFTDEAPDSDAWDAEFTPVEEVDEAEVAELAPQGVLEGEIGEDTEELDLTLPGATEGDTAQYLNTGEREAYKDETGEAAVPDAQLTEEEIQKKLEELDQQYRELAGDDAEQRVYDTLESLGLVKSHHHEGQRILYTDEKRLKGSKFKKALGWTGSAAAGAAIIAGLWYLAPKDERPTALEQRISNMEENIGTLNNNISIDDDSAEIAELRGMLQTQPAGQIEIIRQDNVALGQRLDEIQTELREHGHEELAGQITALQEDMGRYSAMQQDIAELRTGLQGHEDLTEQIERLNTYMQDHEELTEMVEQLRADFQAHGHGEMEELGRRIDQVRDALAGQQGRMQNEINQLGEQVQALNEADYETQIDEMSERMEGLSGIDSAELDRIREQLESLRENTDVVTREEYQRGITRLQGEIDELEGLDAQVTRLSERMDDFVSREELDGATRALRTTINQYNTEYNTEITRLTGRINDLPDYGARIQANSGAIWNLERQLSQGLQELRAEIERLDGASSTTPEDPDSIREYIARVELRIEALETAMQESDYTASIQISYRTSNREAGLVEGYLQMLEERSEQQHGRAMTEAERAYELSKIANTYDGNIDTSSTRWERQVELLEKEMGRNLEAASGMLVEHRFEQEYTLRAGTIPLLQNRGVELDRTGTAAQAELYRQLARADENADRTITVQELQ